MCIECMWQNSPNAGDEWVWQVLCSLLSDATEQTWLFIWMMDKFFDLLNVKGPQMAKLKRKDTIAPYTSPADEQFKVCLYDMYVGCFN